MIDLKTPSQELERLKEWDKSLYRMRLRNQRLADAGQSLITDYASKAANKTKPEDENKNHNEST